MHVKKARARMIDNELTVFHSALSRLYQATPATTKHVIKSWLNLYASRETRDRADLTFSFLMARLALSKRETQLKLLWRGWLFLDLK